MRPEWIAAAAAIVGLTISNALVSVATGAAFFFWGLRLVRDRRMPDLPLACFLLLAAWLIWTAASVFYSGYPATSVRGVLKVLKLAGLFALAVEIGRNPRGFRFLMAALGMASGLTFASAVVQHVTGWDLFLQNQVNPLDGFRRLSASFRTPNDLAAFLIPSLAVVFGLGLASDTSKGRRWGWLLVWVAGLFVLWRTSSRAGWICAAAALLIFAFRARRKLFWALLAGILVLPAAFPHTIGRRLADVVSPGQNPSWERLKLWEGAAAMIREHPVRGFGINTYSKHAPAFRPKDYFPDARYAHNCYLQMASEIGGVGLALFLAFLLAALVRAGRLGAPLDFFQTLRWALVSGLAGFLIHAGFDTDLYSTRLSSFFWIGLGLSVGASQAQAGSFKKILLVRTDRIGELLLTTPAFQAVKRALPDARLSAIVSGYAKEAVARHPDLSEIFALEGELHARTFREDLKLIRWMRERRFDAAIVFNPTKRFHLLTALAGIPVRTGWDRKWGFFLTRRIPDQKTTRLAHEIEHNLSLVRLLGLSVEVERPVFQFTEEDAKRAEAFIAGHRKNGAPLVLLHAGASHETRWPSAGYAELARRLNGLGALVIWIGSKQEEPATRVLVEAGGGVNAAGALSLGELGALISKARLLVCNDSAPMHIASALGTPTVALVPYRGPGTGPGRWGPQGEGHVVLHGDLTKISVDEVETAVRKVLEKDVTCNR